MLMGGRGGGAGGPRAQWVYTTPRPPMGTMGPTPLNSSQHSCVGGFSFSTVYPSSSFPPLLLFLFLLPSSFLQTIAYTQSTTHSALHTTVYPQPTTHNRLDTTDYTQTLTHNRLHTIDYAQPTTHNRLHRTEYIQPIAHNRLHRTDYTTDYTQPATLNRQHISEYTGSHKGVILAPICRTILSVSALDVGSHA